MADEVLVERPTEQITVLRLNRPERLNAMSVDLMIELDAALTEVGRDNQCRVVVLTGAGRSFCSGLDLKDYGIIPDIDGLTVPRIAPRAMRVYSSIVPAMRKMPKPIIAAIRGPAYGGGMCLALGAEIRIAGASAEFNSTGIRNGLTSSELGASWLLPRLIGAANSADIMLTGRIIDADEALRMGLVSRVVPDDDLEREAMSMAETMAGFSPFGLEYTKAAHWTGLETASLAAAIEFEDRNQLMLGLTDNLPEAIRSFRDDRAPNFTDEHRRDLFDGPPVD